MIDFDPVPERVARGVACLDERVPGWRDRVDLATLDVGHPRLCVLGQLFGDFANAPALDLFGGSSVGAITYGFDVPIRFGDDTLGTLRVERAELQSEWERVLGGASS